MKEKLNQIARPLMLNHVVALIIGLCDQAMIGHVSVASFVSVGIVAGIINSLTGVLGATSVSFNILGARAKGNEDGESLAQLYSFYLIQSLIIGLISVILVCHLGDSFLNYFYHLEGEVLEEAMSYAIIFSCSIGLNLMIFTGSSYLKIMNRTKWIFIGNVTATICNVGLDYLLIFGHFGFPKLGIRGNAIGSILALLINLVIYLPVIKVKIIKKTLRGLKQQMKESIKLSLPLMGQEFLEGTVILTVIGMLVAQTGLIEVAVYQLMALIINITLMPIFAYGQAALTLISEKMDDLAIIIAEALKKSFMFYSLIVIVFQISGSIIFKLIINDGQVVSLATRYFLFIALITCLNIPATIYKYGLQAVGREKEVFGLSFISYLLGTIAIVIGFLFQQELYFIYLGLGISYSYLCYKFREIMIQ